MVQVAPNYTIIDLTLRGLKEGKYAASIRTSGDISGGRSTTGAIFREIGNLGDVEVGKDGKGALFVEREVGVQDIVGRSMLVESEDGKEEFLGVIARSAGVWENDKTVGSSLTLSCSAARFEFPSHSCFDVCTVGGGGGDLTGAMFGCWCFDMFPFPVMDHNRCV